MPRKLDIDNWVRKDHYHFFKNFNEPLWGVTFNVDCTSAYRHCKQNTFSFFLFYIHKALVAANAVEALKYRIKDDEVFIYDIIHGSATILRENKTFDFSYIPFDDDFIRFQQNGNSEIERIQNSSGLDPGVSGDDVIHFSSIPWINFTSISHARSFDFPDSCPKISFGQLSFHEDKIEMPVSIHVHHALVDAYHVGQFVDLFQKGMDIL